MPMLKMKQKTYKERKHQHKDEYKCPFCGFELKKRQVYKKNFPFGVGNRTRYTYIYTKLFCSNHKCKFHKDNKKSYQERILDFNPEPWSKNVNET